MVHTTGWLKGLQVTADGTGIVSHAGAALVRALADSTALTAGLSRALASGRLLVHDRGRVLAGPGLRDRRRRRGDAIRADKDCGIGKYPSTSLAMNKAWQAAALTAATLLAWLRLLALDGHLARAEPKTLRPASCTPPPRRPP